MHALIGVLALASLLGCGHCASEGTHFTLPLAARSCVVVSLADADSMGPGDAPLRVVARQVEPTAGGGRSCPRARVSGLELGGGSSAACRGADILHLNGSSLRPAAALSSGAAFFTVESSCAQPSLLRLELSRDSPAAHGGSPLARPLRQLASGAAHRKLLQGQQVVQMPANGSAAPGALPAVDGDKVTPLQPIPAASRPGSPSPAPGPAPGPEQACCCRYVAGVLPYDPQTYQGAQCCCGRRRTCCARSDILARICGNRNTCGVLLIVVTVVCVFMISVCIMGGLCYRRRRNSRAQAEAAAGGDAAQQPTTVSQRRAADAEGERIMALPAEKQQEMSVRAAGGEVLGTSVDCSICLESFEASADNWRLFPCAGHHGACAGCTADMVRHSRRRMPDHKRVVHCPLCRELAIVPNSVLPEDVVAILAAPPPPRRSSRRSSRRGSAPVAASTAEEGPPAPALSPAPLV